MREFEQQQLKQKEVLEQKAMESRRRKEVLRAIGPEKVRMGIVWMMWQGGGVDVLREAPVGWTGDCERVAVVRHGQRRVR